ncbi:DUF4136 domain-containing protein [Cytophagaceae bacterium ABcell3]|nr:DUF4136 domain-containing protein [Cytophagaceae bacterium ABcell3]
MRSLVSVIGLLFIFLCSSCVKEVHTSALDDWDYEQYKTYAWMIPTDDQLYNAIIHQNIHNFVNKEMHDRGFIADSVDPDILIDYRLMVEEQEVQTVQPFFPESPYPQRFWQPNNSMLSYELQEGYYEEGVFYIDIYDLERERHIWSGWTVEPMMDDTFHEKNLLRSVRKIFRQFPVDD